MFVSHGGLLLQFPHQDIDEVGVLDDDGHFFKHVLEPNVGFLQSDGETDGVWGVDI